MQLLDLFSDKAFTHCKTIKKCFSAGFNNLMDESSICINLLNQVEVKITVITVCSSNCKRLLPIMSLMGKLVPLFFVTITHVVSWKYDYLVNTSCTFMVVDVSKYRWKNLSEGLIRNLFRRRKDFRTTLSRSSQTKLKVTCTCQ